MNMTRRKFLALGALAFPAAIAGDACLEPTNLRITKLALKENGGCRFVHFTDFHYKGDAAYAAEVVRTINELAPQFVFFTGDLVEDKRLRRKRWVSSARSRRRSTDVREITITGVRFISRISTAPSRDRRRVAGGSLHRFPKHDLELVGMALSGSTLSSRRKRRAGSC